MESKKAGLVTGSSRGIGAAIAQKLSMMGYIVAIHYNKDRIAAESILESIQGKGVIVQADLSKPGEPGRLIQETVSKLGRLDFLVNNAGHYLTNTLENETDEQFEKIIQLNMKSVFYTCREAIQFLPIGGSIVNISSVLTKVPIAGASAHIMSKGGIEAFTIALAVELGPRQIRANTVSPGYTMTDGLLNAGPETIAIAKNASVFGKIGDPSEIAEFVAFLISPQSAWMTGNNVVCSGGRGFSI